MPGGASGWTSVYIYKGYWDKGTNYKCLSQDIYPIISDIQTTNFEIKGNSPYTQTFNGTSQSFIVFFVFPNGGQGIFHVTYKEV